MRPSRFSIAGIMALTALIALDCLVTRAVWGFNDIRVAMLYFGGLPWLNVLVIGLAVLRGRRRRNEPAAFLVGFEVVGWAMLVSFVTLIFASTLVCELVMGWLERLLNPLAEMTPPLGLVAAMASAMTILTLPQLIVAVAGGLFTRRYRIRIERRERAGVEA
jgi:uncharacterized protein YggT (Ycf19 family)